MVNHMFEHLEKLKEINAIFEEIEKQIKVEYERNLSRIKMRKTKSEIDDYEIEIRVDVSLNNQDKDSDCIKMVGIIPEYIDDGQNHSDFFSWNGHPMEGVRYCFLFHSLYDHIGLTWEEICDIDKVWWEIDMQEQHIVDISNK